MNCPPCNFNFYSSKKSKSDAWRKTAVQFKYRNFCFSAQERFKRSALLTLTHNFYVALLLNRTWLRNLLKVSLQTQVCYWQWGSAMQGITGFLGDGHCALLLSLSVVVFVNVVFAKVISIIVGYNLKNKNEKYV